MRLKKHGATYKEQNDVNYNTNSIWSTEKIR